MTRSAPARPPGSPPCAATPPWTTCGGSSARDVGSSETHPDPTPGPEEQLLQKERIQALERALNTLSARDRNLVYRKYYYLQTTARMAAELGLTERAVEGKLYRIRRKLQKQLGGEIL